MANETPTHTNFVKDVDWLSRSEDPRDQANAARLLKERGVNSEDIGKIMESGQMLTASRKLEIFGGLLKKLRLVLG